MGKANNPGNNSKPQEKVSPFHVLLILIGANLMLLFAPEYGLLNSMLYIPDLYIWPATLGGFAMVVLGFRGFFKKT
jgi:hypothetical protein